jgi:hypothetical protein
MDYLDVLKLALATKIVIKDSTKDKPSDPGAAFLFAEHPAGSGERLQAACRLFIWSANREVDPNQHDPNDDYTVRCYEYVIRAMEDIFLVPQVSQPKRFHSSRLFLDRAKPEFNLLLSATIIFLWSQMPTSVPERVGTFIACDKRTYSIEKSWSLRRTRALMLRELCHCWKYAKYEREADWIFSFFLHLAHGKFSEEKNVFHEEFASLTLHPPSRARIERTFKWVQTGNEWPDGYFCTRLQESLKRHWTASLKPEDVMALMAS